MPSIEGGGVEKNFFLISNFLIKRKKNVTIITISKKFRSRFNKKIKFVSPKFNFWDKLSRRTKFILGLIFLTKEILVNKDPVVLSFQANIYCGILSRFLPFKLIIRSNSAPDGWSKNFIKQKIYKFGLSNAQNIIVNSQEFKKKIKNKFRLNSTCIYNPLNKIEIIKLSKRGINFSFFKKDYLNIINVGRLEEQKDHQTLIKAINFVKNKVKIKLLIIGNGKLQKKLDQLIKINKLEKNVKILNNISNPYPYILKSDLFILSSLYEGLPNVLLEAITLNKFVISTNCPTGPKEILSYGKGGTLVPIKNYQILGNEIIRFKNNKKKLTKKLRFARGKIYRFDQKKNLEKYLECINNVT
tara:strand:- start:18775 stop:19845 length:1071 start_codon:yes stop_codon:yes gene_type:complete